MAKVSPESPWVQAHDGERIKVLRVDYVNADRSGGNLGIYVYALHKKVPVWGIPFVQLLPGSEDAFATRPNFVLDMTGGGFDPGKGQRGPFKIQMNDCFVDGMGLPLNRHVIYIITFNLLDPPF